MGPLLHVMTIVEVRTFLSAACCIWDQGSFSNLTVDRCAVAATNGQFQRNDKFYPEICKRHVDHHL